MEWEEVCTMGRKVVIVRNPRNGTDGFLKEAIKALRDGCPVQIDSGCVSVAREESYTEESYLQIRSEVPCMYKSGNLTIFPKGEVA